MGRRRRAARAPMTSQQTAELLTEVQELIREREREGVAGLADRVGAAEWADLVPQLEPAEVAVLLQWLPDDEIPSLLEELTPSDAARILRTLAAPEAAQLLEDIDPDDAADIVELLPARDADEILVRMRPSEAAEIRELSIYPRDSAGGIMTPAFVAVTRDATATEAIAAIRRLVDQAETVNYVYVVDDQRRLLGVLSLYRLILSQGVTAVSELMAPTTVRVRATADQEVAARLLTDRNLLAIPVVDDDDRLLGIITEDDVADVLQAEATEDIERLGGSQPLNVPYRLSNVQLLVRKRVVWLLVLFVAEAYTGTVLRGFQSELSTVVALGFFIPLLIGTGGNIGSQTVTLIVRAMAIGEVSLRDVGWIVFKELRVGLIMGAVMGVVGFGQALLLGQGTNIGLVVAVTVVAISAWAATVAAALPLVLRRLGVDPAVVSAPFISTLVDGTGLIIYFEIARFVLQL
jgi:magnesium transporter